MASSGKLVSVDFEVHGNVQGVFFRAHTQKKAVKLNIVGWVMNTNYDTVAGAIQGAEEDIAAMKHWLEHTGSPKSRIDRCIFKNEDTIEHFKYNDFDIVRPAKKKKKPVTGKKR